MMPNNQTTCELQHCQISIGTFFPADQQSSITIEPTMRPFNQPASCSRTLSLRLGFVATPSNPRHHASLPNVVIDPLSDIAQIQTQPRTRRLFGLVNHDLRQRLLQQHAIVSIGTSNHQRQWQPVAICEQTALDAPFAAVGRVGADFFPHTRVPWSSYRPVPASPNRSCPVPRTLVAHRARIARIRRHRSILGNVGGPMNANTSRWHQVPPIASPCAATAGSHPWQLDSVCVVDGNRVGVAWVVESMAPFVPTLHHSSANRHRVASSLPCPPNRNSCSLDRQNKLCFNLVR